MCGRYTLTNQKDVVAALEVAVDRTGESEAAAAWWKPRFNVAPTQPAPVVVLRDGARTLEMMRWGLVPPWSGSGGSGGAGGGGGKAPLMINARVESVGAKQVYRDALAHTRCLVVADGFLEWARGPAGTKAKPRPYWFHPAGGGVIAFAGLWTRAGALQSFTILTGAPNPLVAAVHDRMPVVLAPEAYAAWLDPAVGADAARACLGVAPLADWRVDPVSTRVNAAGNDDPACLAPPDPELF